MDVDNPQSPVSSLMQHGQFPGIGLLPNSGLAVQHLKINSQEASVGRKKNIAFNQKAGDLGKRQTQCPQKPTPKILLGQEKEKGSNLS